MAKFVFIGTEKYTEQLKKLAAKDDGILKYAIYPGAAIVADEIRAQIEANHEVSGDLAESITLVKIKNDNGYVNTKMMFAGYDSKGVPNAVKAAALESGSSRGQKGTHFISKSVRKVRAAAEKAMAEALDEKIKQVMEE